MPDPIAAFVTLFGVIDPLGLGPIFLGLTRGMSGAARRSVALRASMIAFAVLAGAATVGEALLRAFGIGLPAFRIAGGLLLFAIAFEMVFERRQQRKSDRVADSADDWRVGLAAYPVAVPLMAGPGAITAVILLSGPTRNDPAALTLLLAIVAVVALSCFVVFILVSHVERWLGHTGQAIISRLLGVLLAALAVQFVLDGVLTATGNFGRG